MSRKIWNYFKVAGELATARKDRRAFLLGCIGKRSDGAMVKSINSPTAYPIRQGHAEYKVCRKLDYGAEIYVARVRIVDGEFGMSMPCPNCSKYIQTMGVNRVYYTINSSKYGIWDVKKDYHKVCSFNHL